jgi:hypothetical protein
MAGAKIIVETIDKGSRNLAKAAGGLKKLGAAADSASKQTRSLGQRLESNLGLIQQSAVAVAAAGITFKKAFDLSREGASLIQLEESFDLMNQQVFKAPDLLEDMSSAVRGTIKDVDLMRGLLLLTAGTSRELSGEFARAAPHLLEIAKAANKLNPTLGDTSFLYQSIATGIKRSSSLILDNLGIVVKVGDANEKYAEAIGKTVEELNAEEKQMALLNAVLESGDRLIEQVGGNVDSMTDSWDKLTVRVGESIDGLKRWLAEGLEPVISAIADYSGAVEELAAKQVIEARSVDEIIASLAGAREAYRKSTSFLGQFTGTQKETRQAVIDLAKSLSTTTDNYDIFVTRLELAGIDVHRLNQLLRIQGQMVGKNTEEWFAQTRELSSAALAHDRFMDSLEAAGPAYAGIAEAQRGVARVSEVLTEITDDQRKAMIEAGDAASELGDDFENVGPAAGRLTMHILELARAEEEAARAAEFFAHSAGLFMQTFKDSELPFFNETLDELGPKMVLVGGRTADQNRLMQEAQDEYKRLGEQIVDLTAGYQGLFMEEDERADKLQELTDRQAKLIPYIAELEGITGKAALAMREATINEEALTQALFDQVGALAAENGALGIGATKLAEWAIELGLVDEAVAESLIRHALLTDAVGAVAQMVAEGTIPTMTEAREVLLQVAEGHANTAEEAWALRQEEERLREETDLLYESLDRMADTYEAEVYITVQGLPGLREMAGLLGQYSGAQIAISGANFQMGGPVRGGVPIIVGEAGPELFVPPSSGQIVPNHRLESGGESVTGGGSTVINNTFIAQTREAMALALASVHKERRAQMNSYMGV